MKKLFKLTESKLRNIVKSVISEMVSSPLPHFRYDRITEWTIKSDSTLNEEINNYNWILRERNWEVNNYKRFLEIVENTPSHLKGFLTFHGMDEITKDEWITYTMKGYDVAFALHFIEPGAVDICNLVNNSDLKGIGHAVLTFAKMQGGTQMDNYRGNDGGPGKLGSLYRDTGFDRQTWFDEFNPAYQPDDTEWQFDTETFGTPDVEGLERSDHRRRYNNPHSDYKEKFDKRINPKFNK